ncbi:MAG: nitroreductase family protein [Clostridium sp.]|uniref:nitroreductase family protein n=1 Tax=Clostridium sp. TaxID=1506 RepID=UPI002FCC00D2
MNRNLNYEVLMEIKNRWSPRSFSEEAIGCEDIKGLIEAARMAPSCYNEQPWRFIVTIDKTDRDNINSTIDRFNRVWSDKAPVIICIISKRRFNYNSRENYWHMFDTGTAFGYLTLEAERRNLITRAIGGFDKDRARKVLKVPYDYDIVCLVAVGKRGETRLLPKELQSKEVPSGRYDLSEIIHFGKFNKSDE